jgi:hypothetical protein
VAGADADSGAPVKDLIFFFKVSWGYLGCTQVRSLAGTVEVLPEGSSHLFDVSSTSRQG